MDNGQVVQAGIWNVCSQTGLSEDGYSVTEKNDVCSQSVCRIKCSRSECGSLCRHMYDCECYDYANGHSCKHIHAVRIHNHMSATSDEVNATEACATPVFNTASDKEKTLPGEVYTCTCNGCMHMHVHVHDTCIYNEGDIYDTQTIIYSCIYMHILHKHGHVYIHVYKYKQYSIQITSPCTCIQ